MGQQGKGGRGHDGKLARERSTARTVGRRGIAGRKRRTGRTGGEGSWLANRRAVFQFAGLLALCMIGFNVLFLLWVAPSEGFQTYLRAIAGASATVLRVLGDDASTVGTSILSPRYSLNIDRGCDAIQVSALFFFAVLVWPLSVSHWRRASGIAIGTLLLAMLNLVRIVSLYYIGIYLPGAFEAIHIDVWQPAFIVVTLLLWVIWVRWAAAAERDRPHVVV